ncbi:SRPBCC domain-containing protein [Catellatospora citrea]|uniref:SRPBCC family protein n=1 Tax=Catellatospora citrea TaxID=53366 RepID=UPI0033D8BEED
MTEPGVIRCDQFLSHPPARVWQALTDPELHAKWWAAGDVRPVVGHRFTLDMGNWGQQPCEVLAVEPEKLLSYSFATGSLDNTITFRLEPEGTGTRLFFEQAGLDLDSPLGRTAFEGMSRGWPGLLRRIESALAA